VLEDKTKYIIITPAYNEAEYIECTIRRVLAQSVLPYKWIIVDNNSTDDTAKVIQQYAAEYRWIQYVYRTKEPSQSYYSSGVHAIMAAYEQVKTIEFDYLAILDADISLPEDYYEQIFDRFDQDERLGVASGVYQDLVNGKLYRVLNDRRSTPKALQVFRKACFEQIGGYLPLKYGGEDTYSCIMARMNGWKSWSFPELCVVHNKPVGMGHAGNLLKVRFRHGLNEYGLATHPLFMLFKSLRRCIKERPIILGGIARMAGFIYGYYLRERRQIPDDVIHFIRNEQIGRLFNLNRIPKEHQVNIHYEC
jgi:biofilm PGA synthesis N-glycosyltransferase PgaC